LEKLNYSNNNNNNNKKNDDDDYDSDIFVIIKKHTLIQIVVVVAIVLMAMVVATIGITTTAITNNFLAQAQSQVPLSVVLPTTTSTTQDQRHLVPAKEGEACRPQGLTYCSSNTNSCTNLQTDKNNCGKCGNRCSEDQICQGGICTCPAGQIPKHCPQIAANFLSCIPSGSCFKDGDVCQSIQSGCHSDSQCPPGFQCVL
jgi:Stigma-specific protein, Stig1